MFARILLSKSVNHRHCFQLLPIDYLTPLLFIYIYSIYPSAGVELVCFNLKVHTFKIHVKLKRRNVVKSKRSKYKYRHSYARYILLLVRENDSIDPDLPSQYFFQLFFLILFFFYFFLHFPYSFSLLFYS